MRASITKVDRPGARAILFGMALTLVLLAIGYAGTRGHHAWNLHRNERAWLDWQAVEVRRAASRYGEVRLPLSGELCNAYVFDNWHGDFVDERRVLCETPEPPRNAISPGDGYARMQGISNAFKR